jgi:flagellar motor switch protein FliG
MTNEEKAAIIVLALEEDLAAAVMKNLRPTDIRRLGKHMSRITNISADVVNSIAKEFCSLAKEQWEGLSISADTSQKIVLKALGDGQGKEILNDISNIKNSDNPIIDKLKIGRASCRERVYSYV